MHFKMLSAICFNLDQSKVLSSGNGLSKDKPLDATKFKMFADKNLNVTHIKFSSGHIIQECQD